MPRILVIDDDSQVRAMLKQMLEREGYEVAAAPDGKVGMRDHQQNAFDLIITDLFMPEKEGLETIRELKQDYPGVKIIAISGGGRVRPDELLDVAEKLGAERTFLKPIIREEMVNAVRELLS